MAKRPTTDDPTVPQEILQAQRIKLLEGELAAALLVIEKQQRVTQGMKATMSNLQTLSGAKEALKVRRDTRVKYTKDMLIDVFKSWQAGEPMAAVAERLGADLTMMKTFVRGEYWTAAALDAYLELGISRKSKKGL